MLGGLWLSYHTKQHVRLTMYTLAALLDRQVLEWLISLPILRGRRMFAD